MLTDALVHCNLRQYQNSAYMELVDSCCTNQTIAINLVRFFFIASHGVVRINQGIQNGTIHQCETSWTDSSVVCHSNHSCWSCHKKKTVMCRLWDSALQVNRRTFAKLHCHRNAIIVYGAMCASLGLLGLQLSPGLSYLYPAAGCWLYDPRQPEWLPLC